MGEGLGRQGQPHVAWAVDKFEDSGGSLVFFSRLDAKHAGIATGAGCIPFTEFAKEFGEVEVWSLRLVRSIQQSMQLAPTYEKY
jgi:hypothetical protein